MGKEETSEEYNERGEVELLYKNKEILTRAPRLLPDLIVQRIGNVPGIRKKIATVNHIRTGAIVQRKYVILEKRILKIY